MISSYSRRYVSPLAGWHFHTDEPWLVSYAPIGGADSNRTSSLGMTVDDAATGDGLLMDSTGEISPPGWISLAHTTPIKLLETDPRHTTVAAGVQTKRTS